MRPPTLDRWVVLQCHRWGIMGRGTVEVLRRHVRPAMRVADVGANQGLVALLMSRLVGSAGGVIALEPDPRMAAVLRANVQANDAANVTVIEAGADNAAGYATLYRAPLNAGDNRLAQGGLPGSSAGATVRLVRLDDVIPEQRLDFMKIDTQGWELNVLEGMPACLCGNPRLTILFELWPRGLLHAGREPADLLNTLFGLGFRIETTSGRFIEPSGALALIRRLGAFGYTDLVASRP